MFLALTFTMWAQEDSSSGQASSGAPPAATGTVDTNLENPPLSGLDTPKSEPTFGGRSYLLPGVQASESVFSNLAGNNSGIAAVSQLLGSVDLQKLWKRYVVGIDYLGGGSVYTGPALYGQSHAYQVHSLAADQRFLWRTGQLAVRDNFDYLPEGTFGFGSVGGGGNFASAIGGITGVGAGTGLGGGLAGGTPTGLYGGGSFGSIGYQPRIDNLVITDVTQELSPRSSVTLGGAYGISDYLNKSTLAFPVVNSEQTTGQAGYNHLLGRNDQIALLYAFQEFHFPEVGAGNVDANIINAVYAHRINGRLNLVLGGGPELIDVHHPPVFLLGIFKVTIPTTTIVTGNGHATLDYLVSNQTHVSLMYQRYVTSGSGLFAGASTNAVRAQVTHIFGRLWSGSGYGGYSYNSSLNNSSSDLGINSGAYKYWFAGGSLRRQLSPHFDAFVSYQFNAFGANGCTTTASNTQVCGHEVNRNTGSIGIDWRPRPIRLD
jgi:hypothetical protein